MLKFLWYYLMGYLVIHLQGSTMERFLNMASFKRIDLWHIQNTDGKITARVSRKHFKKLQEIADKTGCRYHIIHRRGLPFWLFRYRKRQILLLGAVAFVGFLSFLTSFIWAIDVEGHERIAHHEIIDAVHAQGLQLGTFRHTLHKHAIEEHLLNTFDDMSFVNIGVSGTRAVITISENVPQADIYDRQTPTQLVSQAAGIVQRLEVSAGEPLVAVGDIVAIGDVLVSSFIQPDPEISPGFFTYVHSAGQVYAYVYYNLNFDIPRLIAEQVPTGRTRNNYSLQLMGRGISLPNFFPNFQKYDIITTRTYLNFGENYPLPVRLTNDVAHEYALHTRELSADELSTKAHAMVQEAIVNFFEVEVDIDRKRVDITDTDTGIRVSAGITTIQNIAIEAPIPDIIVPQTLPQDEPQEVTPSNSN